MKKILIIFSMMLLLLSLFTIPNGYAATGDVLLVDWDIDEFNLGVTSDSNTYVEWERKTGDDFKTSNAVVINSGNNLLISNDNTNDEGWINITEPFSYVSSINMSFYASQIDGSCHIYFYNNSIEIMDIMLDAVEEDIETYNIGTTDYVDIYNSVALGNIDANDIWYLVIKHISGNLMNYTIYNHIWNVLGTVETGMKVEDDWVTFDGIKISSTSGSTVVWYADDIIINTEGSEAGTGGGNDEFNGLILDSPLDCGVLGTMPILRYQEWYGSIRDTIYNTHHLLWGTIPCNYIEIEQNKYRTTNIYYVDLFVSEEQYYLISSNGNNYHCRVNNNPFTFVSFIPKTIGIVKGMLMRFAGNASLTDEKPLFCFDSDSYYNDAVYGDEIYWSTSVLSSKCNYDARKHQVTGDYLDGQLDGVPFNNPSADFDGWYFVTNYVSPYVQYWYSGGNSSSGTKSPVNEPEKNNLTAEYGDSFIEFYHLGYCDYGIGSKPTIIYHLNNTKCNLYDKYYFQVIHSLTETVAMEGYIDFTFSNDEVFNKMELQKKFVLSGQYYIALWNITNNMQQDALVMVSQDTVIVCEKGTVGYDIVEDNVDTDNVDLDAAIQSMPIYMKVIFALFIIILLTFTPYAFAIVLNRGSLNINIPDLVYVAFFFLGVIISILLGFISFIALFIILFGLIITMVVLWIQKNGLSRGE